jgi:hypothetical protein
MDVQQAESVGIGDQFGERPQGCCAVQRAVGPVLVVEGFELGDLKQPPDQQVDNAFAHVTGTPSGLAIP